MQDNNANVQVNAVVDTTTETNDTNSLKDLFKQVKESIKPTTVTHEPVKEVIQSSFVGRYKDVYVNNMVMSSEDELKEYLKLHLKSEILKKFNGAMIGQDGRPIKINIMTVPKGLAPVIMKVKLPKPEMGDNAQLYFERNKQDLYLQYERFFNGIVAVKDVLNIF